MNHHELVTQSYGRCLTKGNELFDRFYDHFFKSSPRIAHMFRNTDMTKQKKLLRAGINYAIMFSTETGHQVARGVLVRIRESHAQKNINVAPDLYPLWISTLLKAIEETDERFAPELKLAWKVVLQKTVDFISAGYLEERKESLRSVI